MAMASSAAAAAASAVVASVDLPPGLESPALTGRLDVQRIFVEPTARSNPGWTLKVSIAMGNNAERRLVTCGTGAGAEGEWMDHVQWARDCHAQNLQVVLSCDKIFFRTIRHVCRGEELFIWFAEDVAKELGIPFLTPVNIQGQQQYVCHICGQSYPNPNPLKIHLAFNCNDKTALDETPLLKNPLFNQMLTTSTTSCPPLELIRPPLQLIRPPLVLPCRPAAVYPTHPSAIVLEWRNIQRLQLPTAPGPSVSGSQLHSLPLFPPPQPLTILKPQTQSRRGHQCIYCGKMYSRKYGLKIHIRTHTGYKPLKCRICLRPFGDPSNLNKHVRLHAQGDTPYRCDLCGKVLVRRRDLERHVKSRHPNEVSSTCDDSNDGQSESDVAKTTRISASRSSQRRDDGKISVVTSVSSS